jgi:hypothetical protein
MISASPLLRTGSPFAVILHSPATVLVAGVSHFQGVRSLRNVRSLGHSAPLVLKLPVDWPAIKVPALSHKVRGKSS